MSLYYYAAFIPSETGFSIFAPDLPEVASQGYTIAECMEMASDAVASVIEEYGKARKDLPAPSSLETARMRVAAEMQSLGEAMPEGTQFQLIKAPSVDMTPVKISISIAKSTLDTLDRKAAQAGLTRSGFIAKAAQAYPV